MFFENRFHLELEPAVFALVSGLREVDDLDVLPDARLELALDRAQAARVREVRVEERIVLADSDVGICHSVLVHVDD